MKIVCKILCISSIVSFIPTASFADFGLIYDRDGYVNMRDDPNLSSHIGGTVKNNSIVFCNMEGANSKFCFITSPDIKDNGFIYKDRVNFFKGFNKVPLRTNTSYEASYQDANVLVHIKAKTPDFTVKNYTKDTEGSFRKYKNKIMYGTDGDLPSKNDLQLSEITVSFKGKIVTLISNELENLFIPLQSTSNSDLKKIKVYYKNNELYLVTTFYGGGGKAYDLAIYINNGKVVYKKMWDDSI